MKNLLLLFCILIAVQSLSQESDPAIKNQIVYDEYSDHIKSHDLCNFNSPSFTISDSLIGENITIYVVADDDLFTGWVNEKPIWSVTNFDNWSLNTRLEKDPQNNLYAAVKLDEQSSPNNNFDMFKLHNNGEIEEQLNNWNGPGGNPLIINNPDENIYLGQPTIDTEGAIDSNNITYLFTTWASKWGTIYFSKIDADGTVLITNEPIITGINAWAFGIRPAIDCNNKIYIVWSDDMHDITYAYSENSGDNWSDPISIAYNANDQMNKPDICCDNNNNVHIVWQRYSGGCNLLAYMKLRPDGSVAIDESHLTQTGNQGWCPRIDVDEQNNLHITWAKSGQNQGVAQYTKINGNLDATGVSLTDDELTLIQEEVFEPATNVRYPKCIVDGYENVHSIYEKGDYGLNTPKSFCYKKRNSAPLLKIECPNDSVLFVEMTGSGTNWEGTFTPPEPGIYNVRVSGSDIDGNTGFDFYQFEYISTNIRSNKLLSGNSGFLMNYPNPFNELTVISYTLKVSGRVSLEIYDMQGQEVRTLVNENQPAGEHSVVWDGLTDRGEPVDSGIYFYRIQSGDFTETKKCILLK